MYLPRVNQSAFFQTKQTQTGPRGSRPFQLIMFLGKSFTVTMGHGGFPRQDSFLVDTPNKQAKKDCRSLLLKESWLVPAKKFLNPLRPTRRSQIKIRGSSQMPAHDFF